MIAFSLQETSRMILCGMWRPLREACGSPWERYIRRTLVCDSSKCDNSQIVRLEGGSCCIIFLHGIQISDRNQTKISTHSRNGGRSISVSSQGFQFTLSSTHGFSQTFGVTPPDSGISSVTLYSILLLNSCLETEYAEWISLEKVRPLDMRFQGCLLVVLLSF